MEQRLTPALQVKVFDGRQAGPETAPVRFGKIAVDPAIGEGRARAHRATPGTTARDLDLQRTHTPLCHRLRINHQPSSAGIDQRLTASSVIAVPPT